MGVIEGALFRSGLTRSATSRVFTVDPSISGSLQTAIDASVSGNGDIIVVQRGEHSVTSTVNFNKSGIMVIRADYGVSPLAKGEYNPILADASFTDGPVATITKPCYIEGFAFASRDTGSTFYSGAALLIGGQATADPFGVHIRGCRFPKWGLDNRIGIAIEGSSDCLIEDCSFEGVGSALESGIYVQGATQNLTIRRNHFHSCTYAVTFGAFAGGGPHIVIQENVLEESKLLDAGGNAATGHVLGNWSEEATDTGTYDDTVTNEKSLGLDFSGNHYSE